MKTAIYLRVSTDMQEVAHQRHTVDLYCRSKGYESIEIYTDDGISGSTMNRPGLKALMADVRAGKIARLVTFEMSRLSRDFMDFLNIMQTLTAHDVIVEVPGQGIQAFETPTDKLLQALKGFTQQQANVDHSARIKSGIAKVRAAGATWGPKKGEQRSKGYRKDYDLELIKDIQMLRRDGVSIDKIAQVLKKSTSTVKIILRRYAM